MSRSAAVADHGRRIGETLYRRFHAMRVKANNTNTPFKWSSFDEFYLDFKAVCPEGFDTDKHRFKFDATRTDADGKVIGYAPETMTVRTKYEQIGGRRNPKSLMPQPVPIFSGVFSSEVVNIACYISEKLNTGEYDSLERLIAEAIENK